MDATQEDQDFPGQDHPDLDEGFENALDEWESNRD